MKIKMCLLVCLSVNLNAQTLKNNIFFTIGPSIAVGNLANYTSAPLGCLSLSYHHMFDKNFGIGVKYINAGCVSNSNAVINKFKSGPELRYTTKTSCWDINSFMVGVNSHFLERNKFIWEGSIYGGIIKLSTPETEEPVIGKPTNWYSLKSSEKSSFGINIRNGLRYKLSGKLGLVLDVNYIAANYKFDTIETRSSNGITDYVKNAEQYYSTINFSFGIGVSF